MAGSPHPQFFVARDDGTITPLIAVDELPSSIHISGVPPTITPADTQNMTSLGLRARSNERYVVSSAADSSSIECAEKCAPINVNGHVKEEMPVGSPVKGTNISDIGVKNDDMAMVKREALEGNGGTKNHGSAAQKVESWRKKVQNDTQVIGTRPTIESSSNDADADNEPASAERHSKSSEESTSKDKLPSKAAYGGMGTRGTLGKKVYCTHWIRWGECDYTQQGCLYKHEMPDEKKLQEIGIATYPRWYRIANPEKFNGDTDGPVYHRRPGPAPTDQLWRGPPPARPVEPQTYEDFRSNARPAPTPAPIHRQPFGPRVNQGTGPIIFAFDPDRNTFQSFGGFGNFRPNFNQQSRATFNRGPVPRVANTQPPFVRQQRPELPAASTTSKVQNNASSEPTQHDPQVMEITELTPEDHQTKQSVPDAASTSETKSTHLKRMLSQPSINGNDASKQRQAAAAQQSPTKNHNNSVINPAMTNGNHPRPNYGLRASSHQDVQGRQGLNEAYQPLVPSPKPRQSTAVDNDNITGSTKNDHYVPLPPTLPTIHKRYFVPGGKSRHTATINGSPGDVPTNGGSHPKGHNRKDANTLVDV